jgi:hypothetical protein
MFQAVQDLLLSSFKAILGAMALGAAAFVRAWWQSRVTALEVESVERESKAREGRGQAPLSNYEKKSRVMTAVHQKLPRGVRPLNEGNRDKLVERVVPVAKKRMSDPHPMWPAERKPNPKGN